jgi:hypothetical protein
VALASNVLVSPTQAQAQSAEREREKTGAVDQRQRGSLAKTLTLAEGEIHDVAG